IPNVPGHDYVGDVADKFGVTVLTVYRWMREKKIKSRKVMKKVRAMSTNGRAFPKSYLPHWVINRLAGTNGDGSNGGYLRSQEKTKRHKHPAEEKHKEWEQWHEKEKLSLAQVALRHKDRTGEEVTK